MHIMKRWRWRPGGLQWRIIISYFLVTLVAALTIELALTISRDAPQAEQAVHQELSQKNAAVTAWLIPYLKQMPIDQAALRSRFLRDFRNNFSASENDQATFAAVIDAHGQPLVAAICLSTSSPSSQEPESCTELTITQTSALLALSSVQKALNAALKGAQQPVAAQQSMIAYPIFSEDRHILGALITPVNTAVTPAVVAPVSRQRTISELINAFLYNLQDTTFNFILLATILGTVTGILISGGITRRLRRIMLVATAWSRGELQITIFDRSGDEVGQLARNLNQMAGQLQTLLATRQELAVLEERNRMARDLHDVVKQHVFANALLIRAAGKVFPRDPGKGQAYLAEAEALAVQTQQELSELIHALRPAAIATRGLAVALQDYAHDWERRMSIDVRMQVQGAQTAPHEYEETLFRVAQEALANIARHSYARQVDIDLIWSIDQVHLTIHDNGQGFDPACVRAQGVGLASMRERVEALDGTFQVFSSQTGTTIEAFISLSTPAPVHSGGR